MYRKSIRTSVNLLNGSYFFIMFLNYTVFEHVFLLFIFPKI